MEHTSKIGTRKRPAAPAASPVKSAPSRRQSPTHEEIALRARELFLQSGCQPGRDVEFWLEAEHQLRGGLKT